MRKSERYNYIIDYFVKNSASTETELHYRAPFELLVAVMLSAQCTDKRINQVTPPLFEAYPTAYEMAQATPEEIFYYIKSVSYPNSKASHLSEMAKVLVEKFNGTVPDSFDNLIKSSIPSFSPRMRTS